VLIDDTLEETVFKIYEQLKGYNNRLSDFTKTQKECLTSLKNMEK